MSVRFRRSKVPRVSNESGRWRERKPARLDPEVSNVADHWWMILCPGARA